MYIWAGALEREKRREKREAKIYIYIYIFFFLDSFAKGYAVWYIQRFFLCSAVAYAVHIYVYSVL